MSDPLGLESKVVRVVPYDPRWTALFHEEVERLSRAIALAGLPPLRLEHIGSTAVPGLAAKPVLDIAAGRESSVPASIYIPAIEAAGYTHRGEQGLAGREFFRRGPVRTHHLHLVERGGEHWRRYLKLRDALRASTELREQYTSLKYELARRYPYDREAYTVGKTQFIETMLESDQQHGRPGAERVDGGSGVSP